MSVCRATATWPPPSDDAACAKRSKYQKLEAKLRNAGHSDAAVKENEAGRLGGADLLDEALDGVEAGG